MRYPQRKSLELDLDSALKKRGWSRRQLAKAMDVSYQWVQQLCTDKDLSVTLATIEKISKAMGVDALDLLK